MSNKLLPHNIPPSSITATITLLTEQVLIEAKKETLAQLAIESDWIPTDEAKKLLGIKSKSKMQQLRDYGEIVFTKPGKIILYSKKSIITYLNKHQRKWEL